MDLTPGERTVLNQIRLLYSSVPRPEQTMRALVAQWPPTHHATYEKAFAGLLAKRLVQSAGPQVFKISDAGLKVMGVTAAKPEPRMPAEQRPIQRASPQQGKPRATTQVSGIRSVLSRLARGFLPGG